MKPEIIVQTHRRFNFFPKSCFTLRYLTIHSAPPHTPSCLLIYIPACRWSYIEFSTIAYISLKQVNRIGLASGTRNTSASQVFTRRRGDHARGLVLFMCITLARWLLPGKRRNQWTDSSEGRTSSGQLARMLREYSIMSWRIIKKIWSSETFFVPQFQMGPFFNYWRASVSSNSNFKRMFSPPRIPFFLAATIIADDY